MVVPRRIVVLVLICMCLVAGCSSKAAPSASPASPAPTGHPNRVIDAALLFGSSTGDWPFFGYDPGHTGYVDQAANRYDIRGRLLWSRHLGQIFSSPVAGLHMFYITSTDGYLYALDQDTGAIVWRT